MYYFAWSVPEKGFYWSSEAISIEESILGAEVAGGVRVTGFKHKKPYLLVHPENKRSKGYRPLEEKPELFSEFAGLDCTPESILGFANKYGWLGKGTLIGFKSEDGSIPFDQTGEGLNLWVKEIEDMKKVYPIWRCLDKQWERRLRFRIHWYNDTVFVSSEDIPDLKEFLKANKNRLTPDIFFPLASERRNEDVFNSFEKGDVIAPAKFLLQSRINRKIKEGVSPRILRDASWILSPYIMPHSLLSAIWLQFYEAVTGQKRFTQCEVCGGLIELTNKNRKTKKVHANCRKRDWAHKQQVLNLAAEGKTIEEIARGTGYKEAKITRWINKKEG
jgi:hypothetical protein